MKIKIQNAWDDQAKSFDRNSFQVKEYDKVISGRFQMSKKDKETDKWVNSPAMSFVCFKRGIKQSTIETILNHGGKSFNVSGELMFDVGKDGKSFFKFNILEAWFEENSDKHSQSKANGFQPEREEIDSEIPF